MLIEGTDLFPINRAKCCGVGSHYYMDRNHLIYSTRSGKLKMLQGTRSSTGKRSYTLVTKNGESLSN